MTTEELSYEYCINNEVNFRIPDQSASTNLRMIPCKGDFIFRIDQVRAFDVNIEKGIEYIENPPEWLIQICDKFGFTADFACFDKILTILKQGKAKITANFTW